MPHRNRTNKQPSHVHSHREAHLENYSFLFESPCEFFLENSLIDNEYTNQSSLNSETSQFSKSDMEIAITTKPLDIPTDTHVLNAMEIKLGSGIIVKKISASGNSYVYKIWNPDLEMFRAVKICSDSDLMHDAANRFVTEAKIAAQLRHPNIIEVYATGKWNESPYIEMEYIDGLSVVHILKGHGALPIPVACAIAISTCRALIYAHHHEFRLGGKTYKGVIHRDLKPHNIMLSNNGLVKLLDFGIARPCDESLYQTVASDKIVGTIQYLSPEQMDGSELDFRSDIYSFGAVLYEMLCGSTTFPLSTLSNIVKAKFSNSYQTFKDLGIKIPRNLEDIVYTCLEYNMNKRYSSLELLQKKLEDIFADLTKQTIDDTLRQFIKDYSQKY